MAHEIFISYAAEDKAIADAVCEAIEAQGIPCWYAPRDVAYGQDFEESIVDAIGASRLIILILTSSSNVSAHVKREIQNACLEEVNVPVLPFRVEDIPLNKALRYYIGSVHWLDAVTPPLDAHLQRLVEHVRARLPRPVEPEPKEEREEVVKEDSVPEPETHEENAKPEESNASGTEEEPEIAEEPALDEWKPSPPRQVPNYLAPAIVSSVFCCLPVGVIAIILSIQANNKAETGDIEAGIAKAKVAKILVLSAIVLGLLAFVMFIFAAALNSSKNVNSPATNQTSTINANKSNTDAVLTGLWIKVVYPIARKDEAESIVRRLTSKGAQVDIGENTNPLAFAANGEIYYFGDRLEDVKKIQWWLSDYETFTPKQSSVTPALSQPQFYVWLPR